MNVTFEQPKGGLGGMLSPIRETDGSHSPLQLHYLRRLNRMLRLRSEQSRQLNEDGVRLLDRAIYSTYCDAVDLGVTGEAQRLLHRFAVLANRD
jgi:hypothetical protein